MAPPEYDLPEVQTRAIATAVREALARRRISRQALADAAKLSISTLEKALSGRRPFTLATTIRLEEALGIPLRATDSPQPALPPANTFGAYSREGAAWLEGRYLTLRPSFGGQDAIFAYMTEIVWAEAEGRLVFREAQRLDAPYSQTGFVSVPPQSGTIYLVTNFHGQYRLAMLGRPTIGGEMYGILATLHAGRGAQLTPTASPFALIPEKSVPEAVRIYGRILPGGLGYDTCKRFLARVDADAFGLFLSCPP